jgi:two-component system NtrC family sensor kinase
MRVGARWWNRLSVQVTAVIILATTIGGSVFLWLVLRSQRQLLMDQTVRNAAFLSDTLLSSLERHMLRNERTELVAAMSAVANQPLMADLRLFDSSGRTAFSNREGEGGRVADKREATCVACHHGATAPEALDPRQRSRVIAQSGDGRILATVTPVYNRPACSSTSCHAHPAEQRVLGVLEVGMSLSHVDTTLSALQRTTALVGLLTIAGLAVTAIVFTRRKLVVPIQQLASGVNRVKAGELKEPVPVEGGGEIAELASAFNEMEAALLDVRRQRLALLDSLERQVQERTAALEKAQERLVQTEKLSSLGRLAASVAHEINNPLSGILTFAKLLIRSLQEGTPDAAERARQIQNLKLVEQETRRCTAIVRGLLDFARERPLDLANIDVNAAVDEALVLVRNQVSLQNITLEYTKGTLPPIEADLGQIRQALLNIIINACDAMPNGGTLRITTGTVDGAVDVRIADTGIGISPEHLKKVFDPFFTTKEKGTGLGLSVVYGIIERHGGSLRIDSAVGAGTTVTITLPAAAPAQLAEATCPSSSPGLAKAPSPAG